MQHSDLAILLPADLDSIQPKDPRSEAVADKATARSLETYLDGRVVFYPGAGSDAHPVAVFAARGTARQFVYADYGDLSAHHEALTQHLQALELTVKSVRWLPLESLAGDRPLEEAFGPLEGDPANSLRPHRSGDHACLIQLEDGTAPIHLVYLPTDGYLAFETLFLRPRRTPYALVVQDHGMGGNHDRFGAGGRLHWLAEEHRCQPEWILWGTQGGDAQLWPGYQPLDNRQESGEPFGAMHTFPRILARRT